MANRKLRIFTTRQNNPSIRVLALYIRSEEAHLKLTSFCTWVSSVSLGAEWRWAKQNSGWGDAVVRTSDPATHCLAYIRLGPLRTDRRCLNSAKYRAYFPKHSDGDSSSQMMQFIVELHWQESARHTHSKIRIRFLSSWWKKTAATLV
jgi:hypothetical protein